MNPAESFRQSATHFRQRDALASVKLTEGLAQDREESRIGAQGVGLHTLDLSTANLGWFLRFAALRQTVYPTSSKIASFTLAGTRSYFSGSITLLARPALMLRSSVV